MADDEKKQPTGILGRLGRLLDTPLAKLTMFVTGIAGACCLAVAAFPRVEVRTVEVPGSPAVVVGDENHAPPPPDARYATGWVRDDESVKELVAALPRPVFALTPAGQAQDIPDHVYLWEYAKTAIGSHVPTRDQGSVGSCVAFGCACAIDYLQCVQRVQALKAGQPPPEFKSVSTEVIYGGSRVQIGGGRIRGDGSVGAWAAQWSQKYGAVARGKYDGFDLSVYSESTCRKFGSSGCPAALEPEAKQHPTKAVSQVRTVAEAKAALASLYPVTVASDVGFGNRGPYQRNAAGQLRASGTWAHQMCLIGYDRTSGFYCMNSWGTSWVGGPTGPGDPPPGGFWIEENTVARMLGQGDSWAYGDQTGFPARALDWNIAAPVRPRQPNPNLFALVW
jgi:hypothetical protein